MVVEEPVRHQPRARAEVGDEPLGRAVGERAALRVEREQVQERVDDVDHPEDRQDRERERPPPARHGRLVERLVLAHLGDREQPPVDDEIPGRERGERARHDGREPVGTHQRRRRKRRRDGEDRHEAHEDVEDPLRQAALAVERRIARIERHDERQHGEDGDEEPPFDLEPPRQLAPVRPHGLDELAADARRIDEKRRDRDQKERERRAVAPPAALGRHDPHAGDVAGQEQQKDRRVGEPQREADADDRRVGPRDILAGARVGDQKKPDPQRPGGVERERAQVGRRLADGRRQEKDKRRDDAREPARRVGVGRHHLAVDALAHEEARQQVERDDRHDARHRAEQVAAAEDLREKGHQRMRIHRRRVEPAPQRHQVRALARERIGRHRRTVDDGRRRAQRERNQPVNAPRRGVLELIHLPHPLS